ncbi:MAG: NfeD family protein [Planctomycetota bacterium]
MSVSRRIWAKATDEMDPFYIALLLFLGGLVVIGLELFLPSAGILGITAATLIVSAIVVGFSDSLASGAMMMLLTLVSVPLLLAFLVKVWPHTPLGRRILLKDLTTEDVMPKSSHYEKRSDDSLIGRIGKAKTKMLPSGIVVIDGEKFDAVSQGFAIEPGDAVKVIDVKEHRIYVEPFDGESEDELPVRDGDILSQPIEDFGLDSLD